MPTLPSRIARLTLASAMLALVPGVARAAAPTIGGLSPPEGAVGATVSITGTGLDPVTELDFNGTAASFRHVSDAELTAVVPSGATSGDVTVASPEGPATAAEPFIVQPNIVLILSDDQRADELSFMPTVESDLVGKGMTFTNAFVVNPLCCPSRTTILKGQYSHTTGIYDNNPPIGGFKTFHTNAEESSTIATWLDAAGYRTALVGKYLNGYSTKRAAYVPPGWDVWKAFASVRSQDAFYYDYSMSINGTLTSFGSTDADYSTDRMAAFADHFIRNTPAGTPLFLYFATSAPHIPPTPPNRYRDACGEFTWFTPPSYNEADVSDKPPYVSSRPLYSAAKLSHTAPCRMLLAVDDAVKQILGALTDTGRLGNTLIMFASDNGVERGEHRLKGKQVPYESSVRIPLIVRYDPLTNGAPAADDRFALNVDFAPTFADAAQVSAPAAEGTSLLPLLADNASGWRTDFVIEHANSRAGVDPPPYCVVRNERWKYVRYSDGFEELYDLQTDSYELDNLLVTDPTDQAVLDERDSMYSRMVQLCTPSPPGFTP